MNTPTLWLQLSSGRGPAECEWVVGQLAPRLSRDLAGQELTVEEIARTAGEHSGDVKSILLRVSGQESSARVQS